MPKRLFSHHLPSEIDRELNREILNAERQRVTLLGAFLAFLLAANLLIQLLPWGMAVSFANGMPWWSILVMLGAIAYTLAARAVLGLVIKRRWQAPTIGRFGNALIETSLPSLMLAALISGSGPLRAFQSNIFLLYTPFIILSILRLDLRLCIWTGFVASVEYLGIWLWHARGTSALLDIAVAAPIAQRSVILLIQGLVTSFVAVRIRGQVAATLRSLDERNRVVNLFGQHVSPLVVDRLLNQKAGEVSETRHVCMMFLDIRDFTTFSERADPAAVIAYLNALFTRLIEIINQNHGIINKFLGDGFMAVFGAPLSDGRDCQNAVAAAGEILAEVGRMVAAGAIPPTRIGLGLHAGEAVTGNVGSPLRKEYTVIGDVVNVAARIEQLNKQFGSQLLVSQAVWEALDGERPPAEALAPLTVKGRAEPVNIWKLA